jgi:NACHT conflict system protein
MAKTLSYADAARLLGGPDSRIVTALDAITGGLLLAAAPAMPLVVLGLFDAKAEFIRLSRELVRGVGERRAGLSRSGRTERIEAAHTVLVVTAYFEELAAADLPFRFADLGLTRAEQESLASSAAAEVASAALGTGPPLPRPYEAPEAFRRRLGSYYTHLSANTKAFIDGLAVGDRLIGTVRQRAVEVLDDLPGRAVDRHDDLTRRLAADFGEVALWSAGRDHAATRAEVHELGSAMAGLHRMLSEISTGRVPDVRRAGLAAAYRAALDRPIIESADAPPSLEIPTLARAYVQPLFRAAEVGPGVRPSDEKWWAAQPVRADLVEFITGHLTSSQAVVAPLLVLGQPGSGKSVLTKVLAAQLPANDFLPVRIVLREVPADAEPQDQIEHAVRAATGERLEWPALIRSAPDALPVVMLDGFDELLQATGVSRTDYLVKIAAFQRREAEQGRPVAVVVTSRTSVADRARPPEDTVAMRLEPFDDDRVTGWLAIWNSTNTGRLAARGLRPLPAAAVLRHRDLAAQPLLLLMLALYDADENALQRLAGELGRGELYRRLLHRFAEREIGKHRPGLNDRDQGRAVERELDRLSVVGLAMFNRGTQWITETDLDADLATLFGPPADDGGHGLRAPLGAAETALGRFFFIHRSRASRDGAELQAYEFLHATFGEYLVARLVWRALGEVAAREAASAFALGPASVDDDRLHALLSFSPLSSRVSILGFLTELAGALPAADRAKVARLVIRLFGAVHQPRPAPTHLGYQPRRLPVPARHAAYSANLVLLAVCVAGQVTGAELFGPTADRVAAWHREALLWRSQLGSEDWSGIGQVLALHRISDDDRRDVRLELAAGDIHPPPIDPAWTYELSSSGNRFDVYAQHQPAVLSRKGYFQAGNLDDVVLHALTPVFAHLGSTVNTYHRTADGEYLSAAHALLEAWLLPLHPATDEQKRRIYLRCADMVPALVGDEQIRYARLLLDRLATDADTSPSLALEVIHLLRDSPGLATNEDVDLAVARYLTYFTAPSLDPVDESTVRRTRRGDRDG